jgi:hypothetical protein
MSLHSKIAKFLGTKVQKPYCDDCISAALGGDNVAEVRNETESMRREAGFLYGGDICDRCGNRKTTTMAMVACGQ